MYKALNPSMLGIKADAVRSVSLAADAGFEGVILEPDAIEAAGMETVCGLLEENRLFNAGFELGLTPDVEGDALERELKRFPKRAAVSRLCGGTRCTHWIMSSSNLPYEQEFEHQVNRLKPFAHILYNEGISFGLEFVGPMDAYTLFPHPFMRTMPEVLRLAEALDVPGCGLLIDTFHMYTAGHEPEELLNLHANQVICVHINDGIAGLSRDEQKDQFRLLPGGSGLAKVDKALACLRRIGYEGPVLTEPFYAPFKSGEIPEEDRPAMTMTAMQSVW